MPDCQIILSRQPPNDPRPVLKKVTKRLDSLSRGFNRFITRWSPVIRVITTGMDILTFVAAFVMLIALIILAGFDYNQHSYRLLFSTIRFIHVFYIINILYNFLINWKAIFTGKRPFRLIIDTLVLITLLPLIYPHPENPWLPFLERILYSNIFNFIILGIYSMIVFCVGILSVLGRRTNPAVILGSSFFFFIILGSFC